MSDMLDEQIAQAFGEVAAEEPEQPQEPEQQGASEPEVTPERPRDAQGRFLSEAEIARQKYLERFGGDVDKALEAAVHADSMIGRQGQQMGDLQKQLQDLQQRLEQPQQEEMQPEVPLTQETVDWLDEQIYQNPYGAAVWALQNDRTGAMYNRVLDAWYEIPGQARQAASFERRVEYQQLQRQIADQQAPLQAQAAHNQFLGVMQRLNATEIPDLVKYAEPILAAAEQAPEIVQELRYGTPEAQERVVRNLYKLVRFDEINQQRQAQASSDQGAAVQRESFVASGSQIREPQTKSASEQWAEANLDPYLEKFYGSGQFGNVE